MATIRTNSSYSRSEGSTGGLIQTLTRTLRVPGDASSAADRHAAEVVPSKR